MAWNKNMEKKDIKKAVALRYKPGDNAPIVIGKGKGIVAEKIVERGKKEDVLIHQDEELVNSLIKLQISEEIPEELYEALAEIIFYVYELDRKRGKNHD